MATLALVAFTAFLIGPPLIGALAHLSGCRWALALLAPLGVAPLALMLPARRRGGASAAVDLVILSALSTSTFIRSSR